MTARDGKKIPKQTKTFN